MSAPTLLVLAGNYVDERVARQEISKLTAKMVRGKLCAFARFVGPDRMAKQVRRVDVERWLAKRGATDAAGTLRLNLSALSGFFAWCKRRGHCSKNPCEDVAKAKVPRYLPRALRARDIEKAYAAAGDVRERLLVALAVQCGLRVAEIAGLEVGDVDMSERTIRVLGKGRRERVLPVPDEAFEALAAYLLEQPLAAGPLIRSCGNNAGVSGISPARVSDLLCALLKRAGVTVGGKTATAHALRHTCATDTLKRGANVRTVQQMLGHASLNTTQVYLGLSDMTELRQAMGGRSYSGAAR